MDTLPDALTEDEAEDLSSLAAKAFSPRTPVGTRELFAGRWDQIQTLRDAVAQIGLHVVIYGERGVGKTSLANIIQPLLHVFDEKDSGTPSSRIVVKVNANSTDTFSSLWRRAFDEVRWAEDKPILGFLATPKKQVVTLREKFDLPEELTIDDVRRTLSVLEGSVFVFDEYDRLSKKWTSSFTDLIKGLADNATNATVVLVGVADTIDDLVKDHASIPRALIQIHMPRMQMGERLDILRNAEKNLMVRFQDSAASRIARLSQGLPHYVHLIGLGSVRTACRALVRTITETHVQEACGRAVKDADRTLSDAYESATQSSQNALYEPVLVACALTASASYDPQGYFRAADVVQPCIAVLRRAADISTFNTHLQEFLKNDRARVLERIGKARAFRYRFRDPLLLPYVLLRGLSGNLITPEMIQTPNGNG